ncbi:hypothetical protein [Streptomyces nigra]|uniref:hypothetical protein n=1 Tax=Streptomyces nigra TaxID=1827580 RepID=UPI0038294A89
MTTSARVLREQLAAIKKLRNTYAAEDPEHPSLPALDRQIAQLEAMPGVGKKVAATDEPYRRTLKRQQAATQGESPESRAARAAWLQAQRMRGGGTGLCQ